MGLKRPLSLCCFSLTAIFHVPSVHIIQLLLDIYAETDLVAFHSVYFVPLSNRCARRGTKLFEACSVVSVVAVRSMQHVTTYY